MPIFGTHDACYAWKEQFIFWNYLHLESSSSRINVCLCVLYRNPSYWKDLDEFWHRGGPQGGEGSFVFLTWYPQPCGYGAQKGVQSASGSSGMHFGENFIKQKLQGVPKLVGASHLLGPQIQIRRDPGPMSFWSCGHSYGRILYKIKVVVYVPQLGCIGHPLP